MLAQSGLCRRIVGRVNPGEDPCSAIADFCILHDVYAGEVRATGVLSDLELSEVDPESGAYQPVGSITGPMTLIQAYGNVSQLGDQTLVILRALVSWNDRGQHRVVGGHMLCATCVTVEFVIDCFDDLTIERALDPDTGMPTYSKVSVNDAPAAPPTSAIGPKAQALPPPKAPASIPTPVAPRPSVPAPGAANQEEDAAAVAIATRRPSGWDMVAAASEALDVEPEDEWTDGLDADLRRGDALLHPRFGRCKVLRVEDEERVVLMDEARKPRTVSLEYISVQRDPDVPDQKVYQVKVGRG